MRTLKVIIGSLVILSLAKHSSGQTIVQPYRFQDNSFTQQVNIGVGVARATNASAYLEVGPTANANKGFLPPRLNTAQQNAISIPANGLFIYNTDSAAFRWYNGSTWVSFGSGSGGGSTWGTIGGILSNQTDLQAALDLKVDSVTKSNDSLFYWLGITSYFIGTTGGGGGAWGTITGDLTDQTDLYDSLLARVRYTDTALMLLPYRHWLAGYILPGDTATMLTPYLRTAGDLSPLFTTVESSHNIAFSQVSQSQNLVFASPNGSSGNPTFRALVAGDLPATSPYTWQQVLTAGSTLTTTNNINLNGQFFSMGNGAGGAEPFIEIELTPDFEYGEYGARNISTSNYASSLHSVSDVDAQFIIKAQSGIGGNVKIDGDVNHATNKLFYLARRHLFDADTIDFDFNTTSGKFFIRKTVPGSISDSLLVITSDDQVKAVSTDIFEVPLTFNDALTRTGNTVTWGGPLLANKSITSNSGYTISILDTVSKASHINISGKSSGTSSAAVVRINDYRSGVVATPFALAGPNMVAGDNIYLQMGKIMGTDNGYIAYHYEGLNDDANSMVIGHTNFLASFTMRRDGQSIISGELQLSGLPTTEQAFILMADVSGNVHRVDTTGLMGGGGGGYTNLTQFVAQTAWRNIYIDGSGDVQEQAFGTSGKVWTSNGASAAPTWETPTGGGWGVTGTVATLTGDATLDMDDNGFTFENGTVYILQDAAPAIDFYDASGAQHIGEIRRTDAASLSIGSTLVGLELISDASSASGIHLYTAHSSAPIIFSTDDIERMRIFSNGNIVINDVAADADFRIESDTYTSAFFLDGANGEITTQGLASGVTTPTPSGTEHMMTIDADGKWGHRVIPSGGGNVSNTGTPLNNQLAIWTNATTAEGDVDLTFDGTDLSVGGSVNIIRNVDASFNFTVENESAGAAAVSGLAATNDNGNIGSFFKTSSGYTPYKTIGAEDLGFYNNGAGNISIINDFASGSIILTAGASSTDHLTIASTGVATFAADVIVPDEAYDATAWNGSFEVPTKNAIRDKIESMSAGGGHVIEEEGTPLAAQPDLNFIGSGITAANDAGNTATTVTLDADLNSWSSVTRASGFDTWAATPSSANLRSALTDENGTGLALFNAATSPGFTTSIDPISDDGATLGTASLRWSDAFFASGATINFNGGNVVMTHSAGILTMGTGEFRITTPGTNSASVPSISSTNTLTNKRITKRSGTVASSGTPTINTDNVDIYTITAQSAAITSFTTNLSGTPTEGQFLWIAITDNGTARAITWGASFEASTVPLPTTTVISTRLDVGFVWNVATSKWRCVASQ